jgi:hypothetical protein
MARSVTGVPTSVVYGSAEHATVTGLAGTNVALTNSEPFIAI